jgi:Fe-S-cluster containining protein
MIPIHVATESRPFPNKVAAMRHHDALVLEHPWIMPNQLGKRIDGIMANNSGVASKRRKLIEIINEVNAAISPHSACKAGCSHCCHISVLIHENEAAQLQKVTGKIAKGVPLRSPEQIRRIDFDNKYRGNPCPFLIDNLCSVYDSRPFVCRQHHSLDDTPEQCDTSRIKSEHSSVPTFNLKYLEFSVAYLEFAAGNALGDIREYFPA